MIYCSNDYVTLRNFKQEEAEILLSYRSDPILCEYQDFMLSSLEETIQFLKDQESVPLDTNDNWKQIAIENQEGILVGDCAIQFSPDYKGIAELGCTIRREYHSKGFATSALKLLIEHCFQNFDLHKFIAVVDIRNLASQRMVTKVGFKKEGLFRKHYWDKTKQDWFDELHFGLLKEDMS